MNEGSKELVNAALGGGCFGYCGYRNDMLKTLTQMLRRIFSAR